MTRLVGKQKISGREAQEMRARFGVWPGPSGDFVAAEAMRYSVGRETIRRILRNETHLDPGFGQGQFVAPPAFPFAGTPTEPPPSDAGMEAEARKLFDALSTPAGETVVNAFQEELGAPPMPQPTPAPPAPPTPDLSELA